MIELKKEGIPILTAVDLVTVPLMISNVLSVAKLVLVLTKEALNTLSTESFKDNAEAAAKFIKVHIHNLEKLCEPVQSHFKLVKGLKYVGLSTRNVHL